MVTVSSPALRRLLRTAALGSALSVGLAGGLLVDDRRQAGFKHRLQGFLQIRVPAAGAHLAVAHRPVPGALQIAGDAALTVAAGHQILRFHQAHQDRLLAVGGGEDQLEADGVFLDQPQLEARRQLDGLEHSSHNPGSLLHSASADSTSTHRLYQLTGPAGFRRGRSAGRAARCRR